MAATPRTSRAPVTKAGESASIQPVAVPAIAVEYAATVARRVHDRSAPVRWSFIRTFDRSGEVPPLAAMLRGGRGGSVRLKTYLSFLWFAAAPPHDVTYPARAWAGLIGLDDPEVNGARRIIDAIAWLGAHDLVEVDRQRGRPSRVRLLQDDGSGHPYELPGGVVERLTQEEAITADLQPHFYVQLPPEFWTNGWAAALSGPAIAMWLTLLVELGKKPDLTELWLSPSEAQRRLGLAEQTRSKGLRQLETLGLISVKRRPISRDAFDFRRMRNVYVLHQNRLADLAGPVVP